MRLYARNGEKVRACINARGERRVRGVRVAARSWQSISSDTVKKTRQAVVVRKPWRKMLSGKKTQQSRSAARVEGTRNPQPQSRSRQPRKL